jgi:hypothetical protein
MFRKYTDSVVGESVQGRAGSTDVVGSGGNEGMSSVVDELCTAECERAGGRGRS